MYTAIEARTTQLTGVQTVGRNVLSIHPILLCSLIHPFVNQTSDKDSLHAWTLARTRVASSYRRECTNKRCIYRYKISIASERMTFISLKLVPLAIKSDFQAKMQSASNSDEK